MTHGTALTVVGLGLTLVTALLPGAWPAMPKELYWAGIALGLLLMVAGCFPLVKLATARLWRRGTVEGHVHYMTAKDAIHYIAQDAAWGAHKEVERTPDGLSKNPLLEAPEEFRQRAAEGKIRSYGRSPETHQHELIPKEHWMSFGLDYLALFREDDNGGRTEMKDALGGYYRNKGYNDLRIVTEDVYATWPKRKAT